MWGGLLETFIEMNKQQVGMLTIRFIRDNPLLEKRWIPLKRLIGANLSYKMATKKDTFNDEAKSVLRQAATLACFKDVASVSPAHLLYGLLSVNESLLARVFSLNASQIEELYELFSTDDPDLAFQFVRERKTEKSQGPFITRVKFSKELQQILIRAGHECTLARQHSIAWRHLLLALLRDKDPIVAEIEKTFGIDYQKARLYFLPAAEMS